MRSSLLISAALHVVLVAALLVSTPRRFEPVPEQVEEVELVPEKDAPKPPEEKKEEPKAEKQSVWDFPDKPKFELPRFEPTEQSKPNSPPTPQATTKQQPPAQQKAAQQQKTQQPSAAEQPAATVSRQAAAPSNSQQAAPPPPQTGAPPSAPPPGTASAPNPSSIFDPANIPKLMDLPNALENGFDAESTVRANLSDDERAAFKAHLRKCWKVPDGLAPATRVVLRVSLQPNGALATEPMLIEASASRDGPAVLQAAKRALKECQPYAFLPAEKYREWKVLDLSFTPRDMAGG